ncbi:hypothetical protein ACFYWS_10290 [Streptomyces sp. NPDC002795]|uniref:hypothetical protein n=1 Tax=Streptomyces sp. NPDC002795 TaxID=3364665 RepID=UPI00369C7F9D
MPVGSDAHRWRTFPSERTLIVAARTLTSTIRVLEVLPSLLRDDPRVTVVFAYDPTSAFSDGSLELLQDSGCRVMPWAQLSDVDPDLILSASENIEVPDGVCPVLVLPHGIGFQKYVPDSRSPHSRMSGVAPDALLETGRAWLALSHPEQERQLLAAHPRTAGRTLLVGDPCLDELLVSTERRDDYRRALGLTADHRLVMVSSTWGPTSLIGRAAELPAQLLAALPWDTYRVGLILHPNVWSAHGAWHIRTLLAAALDAGLLLMPPVHDWRTALVAADAVVGDHGSVTLYAAALGKPVALAAYGEDAVPGTAGAELADLAPRFETKGDPLTQVEELLRGRAQASERYAPVAARAAAGHGTAFARLRAAVYQLLRLEEPPTAPPTARILPAPGNPAGPVTSWVVRTRVDVDAEGRTHVTVRRFPAAVTGLEQQPEGASHFTHLAVRPDEERDRRLCESASVVLGSSSLPAPTPDAAAHWAWDALARWPGSLLAAAPLPSGECLVAVRDGRSVVASATDGRIDPGLAASAVYTFLRAGHASADGPVTLHVGAAHLTLLLRAATPAPP